MLVLENRFIRSTHDKNGEVRDLPAMDLDEHTWIVHMLNSRKAMSFDEIVTETHAYNDQEEEPRQPIASIALGLVKLIEADMAAVVQRSVVAEFKCGDCEGVGRLDAGACSNCRGVGYIRAV